MGGCDKETYQNVTRKVVDCLVKTAEKYGVHPALPKGDIDSHGFKAHYEWDEAASTLTVLVSDKPLIPPCGIIRDKLHDVIKKCGGS